MVSSFFCIFLFTVTSILGQTDQSNTKVIQKLSDNASLKLSDEKKNWPSIPTPKFSSQRDKISGIDPATAIEYDLITKTVRRTDIVEIQSLIPATSTDQFTSQFNGIFQESETIETVFPPDDRRKISPTVDFPWRTICKLYITFPDGNHFVGSGALIGRNDGIGFHCLTAAHCVYRSEFGGWATMVEIIPALDNDYTPFYSAWATKIKTNVGWTDDSLPEYDWACITLDRQIGNFTGWMGRFTTVDLNWYQRIFRCAGYPVELDFGLCLYFDSDSGRMADENFHWYYMDATDGQDGMPVWVLNRNTRHIVSIHIGHDDGSGSNRGIRLNAEKYNQLNQWMNEDSSPIDKPDLVDDGPKWSDFKPNVVVRGFSQFDVWNDVRNIGTAYSGLLSVAYYASLDGEIEPNNDFLIGTMDIPSIPPFTWRDSQWLGIFPENVPAGEYFVGWVIDPENRVVEFDELNNTAFITAKKIRVRDPYIEIVKPNGGEVFVIGESNTIQWITAGGSGNVTIDASYDNGASWENVTTNLSDSGHYEWNISQSKTPAFCCLIKITDFSKNLTDSSDATFVIETRPSIPGVPMDEGEFTNQTALLFTWTGSNDGETGISGYRLQVGSSPAGNDIVDTTLAEDQFSYIANGSHGQTAYARVQAINGVGLSSQWSPSSDGILIDLTPPTIPNPPTDEGEFCGIDSVAFQWDPALDEESGISDYYLQVGTAIDSADIFDGWIGKVTSYKVVGTQAQTLYARIRAQNNALLLSDWSDWSDGITIDLTPPTAPGRPYSESQTINFYDVPFFWDPATDDLSNISNYHLKVIDLSADSQVVFDDWVGNVTHFTVTGDDGQRLEAWVQAQNNAGLIGPYAIAESPISIQLTPALLKLIESSPAFQGEGWDNAIDNDIEDWDGTVTAFTSVTPYPYAIFGFIGDGMGRIEKIKLLTDTHVGFRNRWVTHFRILYSITGIAEQDFLPLVAGEKRTGDWEEFIFPEQTVKFIKLIVDQPTALTTLYCQIGEFQVFGRAEYVQTEKAELAITYGTPTEPAEVWQNAIDNDIEGWDGTVTAMTLDPPAYVIFGFADQSIKNISKIRLLTDTGVRFSFRWLSEFDIQVSTTGTQNADFSTIFSARKNIGDWESFYFDPVPAKYVKLVLTHPDPDESDYCQIGEVEIYTQIDSEPGLANLSPFPISQSEPSQPVELPNSYHVEQNYPNPFNPETTIRYQIPDDSRVLLKVYNMMGQEITTLVDGLIPAGYHSIIWNGLDTRGKKVPSGVYIYQFRAGNFSVTKKMILLE